jgi:hypothetical protein
MVSICSLQSVVQKVLVIIVLIDDDITSTIMLGNIGAVHLAESDRKKHCDSHSSLVDTSSVRPLQLSTFMSVDRCVVL